MATASAFRHVHVIRVEGEKVSKGRHGKFTADVLVRS